MMTMIRAGLIALLFATPTMALAGKLVFDLRLDGQSQSYDDHATATGLGKGNFRYLMKAARLDYTTNLNEKTSVRGRLILTKNSDAPTTRDALSEFVDLFFVNHKVTDTLDVTIGKMNTEMGGTEHVFYGSPDSYLFSAAYTGVPKELDAATTALFAAETGKTIAGTAWGWSKTGTIRYATGAKLNSKVSDQEFAIQSLDLPADEVAGGLPSQNQTMIGVVYKGNFSEKTFQPVLSYHSGKLPGASSGSEEAKANFLAAGCKINVGIHSVDVDYISNEFKSRAILNTGELADDGVKSALLGWSATFDQLTPRLKLESSQATAAGQKIWDITGVGAALEYRPVKEENFRYHLAYNAKTYKPISGDTLSMSELIFGVRIGVDILK